jgi:hypothetical protein
MPAQPRLSVWHQLTLPACSCQAAATTVRTQAAREVEGLAVHAYTLPTYSTLTSGRFEEMSPFRL